MTGPSTEIYIYQDRGAGEGRRWGKRREGRRKMHRQVVVVSRKKGTTAETRRVRKLEVTLFFNTWLNK